MIINFLALISYRGNGQTLKMQQREKKLNDFLISFLVAQMIGKWCLNMLDCVLQRYITTKVFDFVVVWVELEKVF